MGQIFSKKSKDVAGAVKKYKYPNLNAGMYEWDYNLADPADPLHKNLVITDSEWQWKKLKDLLSYYSLLTCIPLGAIILYANIFIGPGKLAPIPEGYRPKHWEYYENPIARFFSRYWFNDRQEDYEKYLHQLYEDDELSKCKKLDEKIRLMIKDRNDYQMWYYKPIPANYYRMMGEMHELIEDDSVTTSN